MMWLGEANDSQNTWPICDCLEGKGFWCWMMEWKIQYEVWGWYTGSNTAASSLYGAQMIIFSSFNLWCTFMRAESEERPVNWELCSVAHLSPHYPTLMQWFYYCSRPHSDHSRNSMTCTSDWDAGKSSSSLTGETTSLFLSHRAADPHHCLI